jgi:chaperonin GroES
MPFRPLHDWVLVRRLESEDRTAGGLIIPDTAQEKPMQGEVIAVGPGVHGPNRELIALAVRQGDQVLFGKYAGTEVKFGGEELLIVKESDLFGIVTGAAKTKLAA